MPCFARDYGIMVIRSEITCCGKLEQNRALLLPVSSKISSKREMVTTKGFAVPSASAQILHPILSRHTTHHFLILLLFRQHYLGII